MPSSSVAPATATATRSRSSWRATARCSCGAPAGSSATTRTTPRREAVVAALLSLDRLRDDDRFGARLVGIGLNVCRTTLRGV